jgi:AraC-like DNA-binding protein
MPHELMTQAEDLAIFFTHKQVKMLAGDNYNLLRVELPHTARCAESVYVQNFNAPVIFSSDQNALTVTTETVESPLEERNDILQMLAASYLGKYEPHAGTTIRARVELAIRRSLATDNCNRESIASALAVHPRTLQRRLEEEGTSFSLVLDQVRRDLAEYYLTQTKLPLTQISFLLGYQEQAIFSRSCRRWFGVAPSLLRKASKVKE